MNICIFIGFTHHITGWETEESQWLPDAKTQKTMRWVQQGEDEWYVLWDNIIVEY